MPTQDLSSHSLMSKRATCPTSRTEAHSVLCHPLLIDDNDKDNDDEEDDDNADGVFDNPNVHPNVFLPGTD